MMAASLLHEGKTVLHGCPQIADVFAMEKILQSFGVVSHWEGHTLFLDCSRIESTEVDGPLAGSMRSSVMLLGSMLTRKGKLRISLPGGCVIGERPIDLHLAVLEAMGADIIQQDGNLCAHCAGRLQGVNWKFPLASVGATENALLAAVQAKGVTVLENCSMEPEIQHLCRFLQAMGAEIGGIGSDRLWIRGVSVFRDVDYHVPPDRIVAGTLLGMAAATRGYLELSGAPVEEMGALLSLYEKMGGQWERISGTLRSDSSELRYVPELLETAPYPGFPTDLQSIWMAVLLTVPGVVRIRETIFENRFRIVPQLAKMGAAIGLVGREACIYGGLPLHGACMEAVELRGGAALVVAALAAEGTSVISGAHFIERGYENLTGIVNSLGGAIKSFPC